MAFEDHGNIWQCRDFVRVWDNTLSVARKQEPILLLAQDTAGHEVLYPLYATPSRTVSNLCTVVEPMGGVSQCDYQDPLWIGLPMAMVDRVTFWKALSSAVSRRWGWLSELCVYRLSDFSMDQVMSFPFADVSPFISLIGIQDIQALLARRGKNLRERVGRLLRRLQDRDCSAVTFVATSDIRDAMRLFCECYRRQWGEPVTAQMPVTQEYWTGLAEAAARLNKPHFSVLKVGEDVWHWHLGFQHRGTLLWYKMTYD